MLILPYNRINEDAVAEALGSDEIDLTVDIEDALILCVFDSPEDELAFKLTYELHL